MKSVMIRLSLVENVNKFVNVVSRYPFEMDLRAGRHVVDAKSILGIFSLDLSRPITLDIYSDDCGQLLEEIKPFVEEGQDRLPPPEGGVFLFPGRSRKRKHGRSKCEQGQRKQKDEHSAIKSFSIFGNCAILRH